MNDDRCRRRDLYAEVDAAHPSSDPNASDAYVQQRYQTHSGAREYEYNLMAPGGSSKRRSNSDSRDKVQRWQTIEKIVATLEKFCDHATATVEHDCKLAWLGHPEREPRQYDVVVTTHRGPRLHRAVVEVQDRTRKVGIDTFQAWLAKFSTVDAQQLICVSRAGYTKTVIKSALEDYGQRVCLMTLKDVDRLSEPAEFVAIPAHIDLGWKGLKLEVERLHLLFDDGKEREASSIQLDPTSPLFEIPGQQGLVSVERLIDHIHKVNHQAVVVAAQSKIYRLTCNVDRKSNWRVHLPVGSATIVKWSFRVELESLKSIKPVPVKSMVYSTVIEDNHIAFHSRYTYPDASEHKYMEIIAVPQPDGLKVTARHLTQDEVVIREDTVTVPAGGENFEAILIPFR